MTALEELLAGSGLAGLREDGGGRLSDGTLTIYLHAGHLHAARERTRISTILGSCVAVCIWAPAQGIGGMNHYMLPEEIAGHSPSPRYAGFAMRELIERLERLGAPRSQMRAKLYGGASVLASFRAANLGAKNVQAGRARLAEARIPIVDEDVGDHHGRKVVFTTDTGEALVKRIGS